MPKLLVAVTPRLEEGTDPLGWIAILLIGIAATYFVTKRRFTGHFVI